MKTVKDKPKTNRTRKHRILIADLDCETSADVPYLFKKAGCEVSIFCPKNSWLMKNKQWDHWIEAPAQCNTEYAKKLEDLVRKQGYSWVIPGNDDIISIMNQNSRDPKLAKKILPLSKLQNREMLSSKAGLSILCQKYRIPTPPFAIYTSSLDLQKLGKEISYPLLLKENFSGGGDGTYYCNNFKELKNNLEKIPLEKRKKLVIQKYIQGNNIAVEALFKKGRLLAYTYSQVLETTGHEFHVSAKRLYKKHPSIEILLKKIGNAFGINGFANMTFMFDPKKNLHYLVEADLRLQTWFRLGQFVGVDFSKAIQSYLNDHNTLLRPTLKTPLIIIHFHRYFNLCLKKGNLPELWAWLSNKDNRWRYIPLYDSKIFQATLINMFKNGIRYLYRKISSSSAQPAKTRLHSNFVE